MKKLILVFAFLIFMFSCSKDNRSFKASKEMQKFVINISNYARTVNPNFIIIPQNGVELAFNDIQPMYGFNAGYLSAINGVSVETLFYNGTLSTLDKRFSQLKQIESVKRVLVSDFISDTSNIKDDIKRNKKEGFICFPRVSKNINFDMIPDSVMNGNANNIYGLPDAQNYLYLINTDFISSKKQMLRAISATNFDVVIIDLFFNGEAFTFSEVASLKIKANGAKRLVISYINIGAAENWRYYWKDHWKTLHPCWIKKKYGGFKDEWWVKFWSEEWQEIIYKNYDSYINKILNAGFDGALLDNVEAYHFLYYKD